MTKLQRLFNIAIPGLLLPMSLGTCYNYSQYAKNIMEIFNITKFSADIGFTLIIFFLGMTAAFCGKYVAMFPKKMGIISTILFVFGMILLAISTYFNFLPLYYIACSCLGSGCGIGYVVPIKQIMMAFEHNKGMAAGLCIGGFGLGKFVFAPIFEYLLSTFTLPLVFTILSGIFLIIMSIACLLFKPNPAFISTQYTVAKYSDLLHSVFIKKSYISIWFMFFINITCGLALISQEKGLLQAAGFTIIAILMSSTAIANMAGRFGMSTLSDYIGRKASYHYICSIGILGAFLCYTQIPLLIVIGILLIEFAYGSNFACLPSLLSKQFGTNNVSTVHAMTLSGWSFAGIAGPILGNLFTDNTLYLVLALLYFLGFLGFTIFVKRDNIN